MTPSIFFQRAPPLSTSMGGGGGLQLAGHPLASIHRAHLCQTPWGGGVATLARSGVWATQAAARLRHSARPGWAIASRCKRTADYESAAGRGDRVAGYALIHRHA